MMAIDAVVMNVKEANGDLILILGPRIYQDASGKWGVSNPGRPLVRVKDFTYRPKIGQFIWGGSDTCRLEDNVPESKKQEYRRTVHGYLVEA
jgi:hypothetical protein